MIIRDLEKEIDEGEDLSAQHQWIIEGIEDEDQLDSEEGGEDEDEEDAEDEDSDGGIWLGDGWDPVEQEQSDEDMEDPTTPKAAVPNQPLPII